ncbi:MAG: hypothetical protein QW801_06070 [Candidatus Caldarchaeum sp.]
MDRLRFFTAFSHGGVVVHRLPNTPRQPLNIPECDVTAGWRLRIPNMYKPLFHFEANDGREIRKRYGLKTEHHVSAIGKMRNRRLSLQTTAKP